MLPGTGDTTPLPAVAPDRSTEQPGDYKDRYIAYLEQSIERRDKENRQLHDEIRQLSNLVSRMLQGETVSLDDIPSTEDASDLPAMFFPTVRQNKPQARELARLLRDVIIPAVTSLEYKRYDFYHVRMVLQRHRLIDKDLKPIDFARDMAEFYLGERDTRRWERKVDSWRKASAYPHRGEPDYLALKDGDIEKEKCLRVEEVLAPVLKSASVSPARSVISPTGSRHRN